MTDGVIDQQTKDAYWRETSALTWKVVILWAVSWVGPMLLHYPLNKVVIFGFPLAYYMAGQGSLIIFVLLIVYYAVRMNHIDQKYGVQEEGEGR